MVLYISNQGKLIEFCKNNYKIIESCFDFVKIYYRYLLDNECKIYRYSSSNKTTNIVENINDAESITIKPQSFFHDYIIDENNNVWQIQKNNSFKNIKSSILEDDLKDQKITNFIVCGNKIIYLTDKNQLREISINNMQHSEIITLNIRIISYLTPKKFLVLTKYNKLYLYSFEEHDNINEYEVKNIKINFCVDEIESGFLRSSQGIIYKFSRINNTLEKTSIKNINGMCLLQNNDKKKVYGYTENGVLIDLCDSSRVVMDVSIMTLHN